MGKIYYGANPCVREKCVLVTARLDFRFDEFGDTVFEIHLFVEIHKIKCVDANSNLNITYVDILSGPTC